MTEENNLTVTELNKDDVVKIYSRKVVYAFSVLFAPIFGGVLLRQNLIDTKRKKEANIVLAFSIIFTVLTIIIVNSGVFEVRTSSLTFVLNLIWGAVLSEYFFKKYFPNSQHYEYKKIWKALLISVIIITPLILVIIYELTE